jgi:hypothetical protein
MADDAGLFTAPFPVLRFGCEDVELLRDGFV